MDGHINRMSIVINYVITLIFIKESYQPYSKSKASQTYSSMAGISGYGPY